jgi:hypothetical protein
MTMRTTRFKKESTLYRSLPKLYEHDPLSLFRNELLDWAGIIFRNTNVGGS